MKKSLFACCALTVGLSLGVCANGYTAEEETKEPPGNLLEMFQKGTVKGRFRTLYFIRDFDEKKDWETIGIGGNLNLETAALSGVSLGAGFKTGMGAEFNSDDDGVYGGMLPVDENGGAENYAALDEYYLKYSGFDTVATLGAQYVFTPAMRGHYIRLTEKKYRGLSVINNSIEKLELHGYYIADYLGWTDEEFKSVSSAFSGNESDDEGSLIGGLIWRAPGALKLQLWDYYYNEVMNQYLVRGQYDYKFNDDAGLFCDLRYFGMQDTGDALAGDIDTYTVGGKVGFRGYGFTVEGVMATNGDDNLPTPFDAPLSILMQYAANSRAEEDAFAVKLGYDLSRIGATGLSAYVFYGHFDTPDDGNNVSTDYDEIDFNLAYKFSGWAQNASVRLRYAIIDKDEGVAEGEDFNDFRIYFDFAF